MKFNGDWGLGIGDWGLGIGPNPQSPIPKNLFILKYNFMKKINSIIKCYQILIFFQAQIFVLKFVQEQKYNHPRQITCKS